MEKFFEKNKEGLWGLLASNIIDRLNKKEPIKRVIPNANSTEENIKKKQQSIKLRKNEVS